MVSALSSSSDFTGLFLWGRVARFAIILIIILGNFGFGIDEHIDLGIKYDTSTGIFGMDFYVVLTRAGKRVGSRRNKTGRVGKFQRVSKEEAKMWFIEKCGGTVLNWIVWQYAKQQLVLYCEAGFF